MCNLYSVTKNQDAIRRLAKVTRDKAGNLPALSAVFPDQLAPVVRTAKDGERELLMMRWGFPSPPMFGNPRPVTNVRNLTSNWWKPWLKPEFRCLVPATSFCEYADKPDPKTKRKIPTWFALSESRPLFFFAGIWRPWTGTRGTKSDPVKGEHLLYSFLTCDPNKMVRPVHSKAMPVILTTAMTREIWLTGSIEDALELQRPPPDKALRIVAVGEKKDAR
jgi:putative SOS response-associated peptidase YedK